MTRALRSSVPLLLAYLASACAKMELARAWVGSGAGGRVPSDVELFIGKVQRGG